MFKIYFYDNLKIAFEDIELEFNEDKYNTFMKYLDMIIKWNEKINLTSITDKEDIIKKHFIDSIKIYKFKNLIEKNKIIDIGTGAGFPGIPLKIANDNIDLTLVDSTLKKVNFLKEVIMELKFSKCFAIHQRAEQLCREVEFREKYDGAVSRAVANLNLLSELSLPLVKKGGYFIALKGPSVYDEIKLASNNINSLGGKIVEVKEIVIEKSDYKHNIVIIEKIKNTPREFPRKPKLLGKNICFT